MQRYLKLGAAGEVKQLLQQRSDLPRCALFKLARHLFKGRSVPSSKEGNRPLSHILPFIYTFEAAGEGKRSTIIRPFGPPSPKGRRTRAILSAHFGQFCAKEGMLLLFQLLHFELTHYQRIREKIRP